MTDPSDTPRALTPDERVMLEEAFTILGKAGCKRRKGTARKPKRGSAAVRDRYIQRYGDGWRAFFYDGEQKRSIAWYKSIHDARRARDIAHEQIKAGKHWGTAKLKALEHCPAERPDRNQRDRPSLPYFLPPAQRKERTPVTKSAVLLSEEIINAKTEDLNIYRTFFKRVKPGEFFRFDRKWYIKRNARKADRADAENAEPKIFAGSNTVLKLRDINQPFGRPDPKPNPQPRSPRLQQGACCTLSSDTFNVGPPEYQPCPPGENFADWVAKHQQALEAWRQQNNIA